GAGAPPPPRGGGGGPPGAGGARAWPGGGGRAGWAVPAGAPPPRGVHLGTLPVTLSVQDGWGIVYSVPAGSLPADGRYHRLAADLTGPGQPAAGQAGGRGGARYPLRLLGLSLSYQLPRFPVPPSGPTRGITRPEARIGGARATRDVRPLAVSARATGGFAAPFAGTGSPAGARPRAVLAGWQAAARAAGLADRHAFGIRPAVKAWRPGTA